MAVRLLVLTLFLAACDSPTATDSGADGTPVTDPPADADADGWPADVDCVDTDATVHPDADERCDGVDQDCDGEVDEHPVDAVAAFADADGDGHGDPAAPTLACTVPDGYAATGDDCDDADARVHPGADEADCADPTDYNCDGSVGWADADADGHAACDDCNDLDPAVSPAAAEQCNGVDDDCDGAVDEAGATGEGLWYADADGDGYGAGAGIAACAAPEGFVADATDCDPLDATVSPGGTEVCDGVDQDCDGTVDEDARDALPLYTDADGDGFGDGAAGAACSESAGTTFVSGDCDDTTAAVSPAAPEVCNLVDDDCDGLTDDDDPVVDLDTGSRWALDRDGDGFGDASGRFVQLACAAPSAAYVADETDCDDRAATVSPAAVEVCGGVDDDCDGLVDDADPDVDTSGGFLVYTDADGDGHGDPLATGTLACATSAVTAAVADDCDDTDARMNPSAAEVCDGVDDDCDGVVDWGHGVPTDYATITDALENVADGSTVCVAAGTYVEALDLGDLDVTIEGWEGADVTTVGGSEGSVVYVDGTTVTLRGLTLTGGGGASGGGVYAVDADLVLEDVVLADNTVSGVVAIGGGVFLGEDTQAVLRDVTFEDNAASGTIIAEGGGLACDEAEVTLDGVSFSGDAATATYAYGGAVILADCDATITDMTVAGATLGGSATNFAEGVVLVSGGTVDVAGLAVTDATVAANLLVGGVLYADSALGSFANLDLSGNVVAAPQAYGAVAYLDDGTFSTSGVRLVGNDVSVWQWLVGGVLYAAEPGDDVLNVTVAGNSVDVTGTSSAEGAFVALEDAGLRNAIVYANTVSGAKPTLYAVEDLGDGALDYTDVYANGTALDSSASFAGLTGMVAVNPGFTDVSSPDPTVWDLTLAAGSPLVDAGDPSILDADGSVSDLGAYGGATSGGW